MKFVSFGAFLIYPFVLVTVKEWLVVLYLSYQNWTIWLLLVSTFACVILFSCVLTLFPAVVVPKTEETLSNFHKTLKCVISYNDCGNISSAWLAWGVTQSAHPGPGLDTISVSDR
jgi:hypothetical protein